MARKAEVLGIRKPMSAEAKAKIAEAIKRTAERKRQEAGVFTETKSPVSNQPRKKKKIELVKMKYQEFDPIVFQSMKTGKVVDQLFSFEGGIPRATNYMIVGDPGVGKSTCMLDILSDLALAGNKVLYISAEMSRIDLYGYVNRFPKFGGLDTFFMGEYSEENPKEILEDLLNEGYDCVLMDSFTEVKEAIAQGCRVTGPAAEKFLIDLMIRHNMAGNSEKKHTTFLAIVQVTKGGVFVGSNKIKHNTTGMMCIRFLDPAEKLEPNMEFDKNRRGEIGKKLFYSLRTTGDVHYDEQRFLYGDPEEEEDEDREEP